MYIYVTLLYNRYWHIINQLYFTKKLKIKNVKKWAKCEFKKKSSRYRKIYKDILCHMGNTANIL